MLINQVKAHLTLTTELLSITKESQMLLVAGNILVHRSGFHCLCTQVCKKIIFASVSSLSFCFLEHLCLETSRQRNSPLINKVTESYEIPIKLKMFTTVTTLNSKSAKELMLRKINVKRLPRPVQAISPALSRNLCC